MKKLLALPIIALIFGACNESPDYTPEFNGAQSIEYGSLTESFIVPVKDDTITVVTNLQTNEELYRGNLPLTIDVPKDLVKNSVIKCFYIPDDQDIAFGTIMRKGIMLFEDTKDGDNDYNDFICQVDEVIAVTKSGDKYYINVSGSSFTPLALGSSLRLGFGFECRDSKTGMLIFEEDLSTDIRASYFDNEQDFINTVKDGIVQNTKTAPIPQRAVYEEKLDNPIAFNWYIKTKNYAAGSYVNENKHYTTEASKYLKNDVTYNQIITDINVPYGIFVNGAKPSNFNWAIEYAPIWKAYPKFKNWLKGESVYPFSEKVDAYLYK